MLWWLLFSVVIVVAPAAVVAAVNAAVPAAGGIIIALINNDIVVVVIALGSDIETNTRRPDMPFILVFTAHPALEMSFGAFAENGRATTVAVAAIIKVANIVGCF